MEISSAKFCELSLNEVADFILDHDGKSGVVAKGCVDGKLYNLYVRLEVCDE